jgi:hypothetical protein
MRDTMNIRSEHFPARRALAALTACLLLQHSAAIAQPGLSALEPWVQVEMTLFTYENANLDAEVWSPEKTEHRVPRSTACPAQCGRCVAVWTTGVC